LRNVFVYREIEMTWVGNLTAKLKQLEVLEFVGLVWALGHDPDEGRFYLPDMESDEDDDGDDDDEEEDPRGKGRKTARVTIGRKAKPKPPPAPPKGLPPPPAATSSSSLPVGEDD